MLQSLSNDQILFATAGYDHTIKFWKPHTGQCCRTLLHNESQVNCMAIYPDRTLLAAGGYQHVSIYNLLSDIQTAAVSLEGCAKNTIAIGFQDRGQWLYTAGEDKQLRIWDMRSRTINCIRTYAHTHPITCVALHPNQTEFFVGDEVGNLVRWDTRNLNKEFINIEPKSESSLRSISVNQEGTLMACVNNEGSCWIWTLRGGFGESETKVLSNDQSCKQPHQRYALKCLFSPDSTLLATSSADGTAKLWHTIDFSLEIELKHDRQRWVWDLAFTNDSKHLFTASSDNMARLWSIQTGETKIDYVGHQKPVVCLAFCDSK